MRKALYFSSVVLLFFLLPACLPPQTAFAWEGRVVAVADGDTITVLTPDKRQVKVRLYGIDCPERRQPFGVRAREATANAVAGKTVDIQTMDTDRYGRTVALVEAPGIGSLQEFLLDSGMAWVYPQYCSDCSDWYAREAEARKDKRGLWRDRNPVPPWMWRREKR